MRRLSQACWLFFSVALLMSADLSWRSKPVSHWNENDAKQVLASSPWVMRVVPALLPQVSEAQLRDGGRMGRGQGLGIQGLDASALLGVGGGSRQSRQKAAMAPVEVRWESALPIHTAEIKAGEDAPAWHGDYYVIAVYDIPGVSTDDVNSQEIRGLRKRAFLRREGKKDLQPARVEVVTLASGLARIVYLFPRSEKIIADDQRVAFGAQIGRLFVSRVFYPVEMQFQGKLEI